MDRRTLVKAGAWTAPVIMFAVAAPTASASPNTVPIDTNPCTNGTLTIELLDPWQKNDNPNQWQGVQVYNHGSQAFELNGRVENSSAHLLGVTGVSPDLFTPSKNGNNADFMVMVPPRGSVVLRVEVEDNSDNDTCFLTVDCSGRLHMKTVNKIDRLGE